MLTKNVCLSISILFLIICTACTSTSGQEPTVQEVVAPNPATATETAVTTPPPAELMAHTWQLLAAGGEADDMFLPLPTDPAWLRFSHHPDPNGNAGFSFEGFSGCNALFGSYVASNNTLTMDVGVTEQGCEPDLAAFEDFMLKVLRHQPTFAVTSESGANYLTLRLPDNESGRLVFIGAQTAVDPILLQNYLAANETSSSLRFLFQYSNRYFVLTSAGIERDYLPVTDGQPDCEAFHSDYSDLGGVVTLSKIGTSQDGTQVLVHVCHECGSADNTAAYYTLTQTDGSWQIIDDPIGG